MSTPSLPPSPPPPISPPSVSPLPSTPSPGVSSPPPYVFNPNPAPLPLYKYVVAGGAAGVAEIAAMYPLDIVKTRLQLQRSGSAAPTTGVKVPVHYNGVADTFVRIVKNEGILTLYRGISSPIVAEAPKRAVKFASNETYKVLFRDLGLPQNEIRFGLAGMAAGITEAFVNCPFEVVKVRMQMRGSTFTSTADAARHVVRSEGVHGVFRGLGAHAARNAGWNGTYFGLVWSLRNRLFAEPTSKREEMTRNFLSGLIAGSFGTIFGTPFDVVKSRMQGETRANAQWKTTIGTLTRIYKEEGGIKACYKGFIPRLLRLGPGGGIMMVAFDYFKNLMA